MPLDTSIALQAKAPEFNPLQQALQVAQYRAYNANGLAAQQQLDANNAASQAFKAATDANGNTDYNKFRAIMAGSAGAYNLPQINQQITAQQQAQQNLDRGNIALNGDQIDNYKKGLTFMTQQFASLNPNDPDFNAKMLKVGADAVQMGHLDPNMVVSTMSQIPQDPTQRDMWFKQKLNAMQDATAQLNNMKPQVSTQSNGQTINTVTTDPLSGKQSTTPLMNQKLSPETLAQQVTIQADDGSTSQMTMADMLRKQGLGYLVDGSGAAQGQPAQGQPAAATGSGSNGRYPSQPATVQTKPAAGVVDANQKVNASGGDALAADQQSNAQSGTRINMLQNAQQALATSDTGQKSEGLQTLRGALVTFGLASQEQANKVASYDEANKYLTQYAQNKAASFGHGTDSQLAAAMTGNGSTKISNLAAQDVVKVNLGLERMEQARMQAWESAGLQPSQYAKWKSQWGSQVDPRVFVADQMDPAKIQGMVKKMNPKEQATFRTQYNWAVQNGFINGPQ